MDAEKVKLTNRTVTNPLDEDFTHCWDGVAYTIPSRTTVSYINYLAEHMAKHLANKILIEKGRFDDIIKNDKRIGSAVARGEKFYIQRALLDRDDEELDLDQVVKDARHGGSDIKKETPAGEKIGEVKEQKVGEEPTREEEEKVSEEEEMEEGIPANLTDEEKEFKDLQSKFKGKGPGSFFKILTKEERERYKELKETLNK